MTDDPIVAEVRRVREALAAKFNYDINAILADIRSRELASGVKLRYPKDQLASETGKTAKSELASVQ